jgi:hypothetical protein
MPLDNTNPEPSFHNARWCAHEDDGAVRLQIELGNDYAVLLTCRADEPPRVTLWRGSGEHDFNNIGTRSAETPASFRQWIEGAVP